MLKRLLPLLAFVCAMAHAQVSVTGTSVRGAGTILASGQWCADSACFTVNNGNIAPGASVSAGTHTVTVGITGTQYLNVPGVVFSGASFNWDSFQQTGSASGVGTPYLSCAVGATYSQTDTSTAWNCSQLLGRGVWTTTPHPIPTALHPGLYAGNGAPTFTCTSPCGYIQNDASSPTANFWDTQGYPGTATTNWVLQKNEPAASPIPTLINISGTDVCAQMAAVDAQYTNASAIFNISGGTCSSKQVLGPGHNLWFTGRVGFSGLGKIVPTQNNDISCPGGQIVNVGMTNTSAVYQSGPNAGVPNNEYNDFFGGTGGIKNLHLHDCIVDGGPNGNGYGNVFYTDGGNDHVEINGIKAHNATLYVSNSAPFAQPNQYINIHDSSEYMDDGHSGGQYGVMSYGPLQYSHFHHLNLSGMQGGVLIFGNLPNGAIGSSNPTYDQVRTSGIHDDEVDHVTTSRIVATNSAVFLSLTSSMTVDSNHDDAAVDVAYDAESTVDTLFSNNYSKNGTTACFGGFYTQYHNTYRGNHCLNSVGFAFQNAGGYPYIVDDILVDSNTFESPAGIGIFTYQHASGHITWRNNQVLNGTWANVSYQNDELIEHNTFTFTYALPCTGIGDNQGPGVGIAMGNNNDGGNGAYEIARDNTIITTVPQPACAAAITDGLSYSNGTAGNGGASRADITGNIIKGPWTNAIAVNSGVTNNAFPPLFFLKDNNIEQGAIDVSNSAGVPPTVKYFNNFVGLNLIPNN